MIKKQLNAFIETLKKNQFLFEELVKRDFKQKYKGTVLGMLWSILSPLLQLLVLRLVFTQFFGRTTPNYTTHLFSGLLVFSFYAESTKGGMSALQSNKGIVTKIKMPKYLLLVSRNVSSIINFLLTLVIFFIFAAFDSIHFSFQFFFLLYPVLLLPVFCIGIGMILSALQLFLPDIKYLYDIFITLLRYLSAIFYSVEAYSPEAQQLFLLNPVYTFILYFRRIVINNTVPSLGLHLLILFYTVLAVVIGGLVYKKHNHKFLYYI